MPLSLSRCHTLTAASHASAACSAAASTSTLSCTQRLHRLSTLPASESTASTEHCASVRVCRVCCRSIDATCFSNPDHAPQIVAVNVDEADSMYETYFGELLLRFTCKYAGRVHELCFLRWLYPDDDTPFDAIGGYKEEPMVTRYRFLARSKYEVVGVNAIMHRAPLMVCMHAHATCTRNMCMCMYVCLWHDACCMCMMHVACACGMFVCLHACMHVCMHACMHACVHVKSACACGK